jgi:uncharacterized protein with HEPN domain
MRDDRVRLRDILDAIARIEKYAVRGRQHFEQDELVQTWIVHHLEIIGEATRGLSAALRSSHPQVPWAQIIAMRNILIHAYFGIDLDEVWAAVERDLPEFKRQIQSTLAQLGGAE